MTAVVLVHGWGTTHAVFEPLRLRLAQQRAVYTLALSGYGSVPCDPYTLESLALDLARRSPARCIVVAWSLGAQIALAWARARPLQVQQLVLLATTPSFVQRDDWSCAMPPETLEQFASDLARDRDATLRRFVSLQTQGDDRAKDVARHLRACVTGTQTVALSTLGAGLNLLRECDLRPCLPDIVQNTLVLHGECDGLIPCDAGAFLARSLPNASFELLDRAGHAPFVSAPDAVARFVLEFCDA